MAVDADGGTPDLDFTEEGGQSTFWQNEDMDVDQRRKLVLISRDPRSYRGSTSRDPGSPDPNGATNIAGVYIVDAKKPGDLKLITFKQLNLLADEWPISGPFDAIFCRNVMIYFDKPTQSKILARFAPLMKPDALLFAGHSENFLYVSNAFKLRGKTVYELDPLNGGSRLAAARRPEK